MGTTTPIVGKTSTIINAPVRTAISQAMTKNDVAAPDIAEIRSVGPSAAKAEALPVWIRTNTTPIGIQISILTRLNPTAEETPPICPLVFFPQYPFVMPKRSASAT